MNNYPLHQLEVKYLIDGHRRDAEHAAQLRLARRTRSGRVPTAQELHHRNLATWLHDHLPHPPVHPLSA